MTSVAKIKSNIFVLNENVCYIKQKENEKLSTVSQLSRYCVIPDNIDEEYYEEIGYSSEHPDSFTRLVNNESNNDTLLPVAPAQAA